jgi:hypothetical protein
LDERLQTDGPSHFLRQNAPVASSAGHALLVMSTPPPTNRHPSSLTTNRLQLKSRQVPSSTSLLVAASKSTQPQPSDARPRPTSLLAASPSTRPQPPSLTLPLCHSCRYRCATVLMQTLLLLPLPLRLQLRLPQPTVPLLPKSLRCAAAVGRCANVSLPPMHSSCCCAAA